MSLGTARAGQTCASGLAKTALSTFIGCMRISSLVVVAAVLVVPAGPVYAAEVDLFPDGSVGVMDSAGAANDLAVNMGAENVYVVKDHVELTISSGDEMSCDYLNVEHTMVKCVKEAGQQAKIGFITAGEGDDRVAIAGAIAGNSNAGIYGGAGNDTLIGGSVYDQLIGGEGDDTITGGAGSDALYGEGGNDTLEARDGEIDSVIECDSSAADDGANDTAVIDANENAHNCKTVDKPQAGGGDDGGGDDGGGGGNAESDLSVAVTVPDASPKGKGKRLRFTELDDLRKKLRALDVPVRLTKVPKKLTSVRPVHYMDHIENGEIFRQGGKHKPGRTYRVDPTCPKGTDLPCRLEVAVYYYDESLDLKGSTCPYGDKSLPKLVEEMTYVDAVDFLEERDCRYRITNYAESKDDGDERIYDASVSRDRKKRGRPYWVNLIVFRPIRSDFTVSIAPRPYSDYSENKGRVDDFEKELDLGKDGKLTFSTKNPGVIHVIVQENFTARPVSNVKIELVKNPAGRPQDSSVIGSSETNNSAAVTFTFPVNWTGDLEVNVRIKAKRNSQDLVDETMRGWITIPVVERPANKRIATQSGRYFKNENGQWKRVSLFAESMKAFADALKSLNKWPAATGGACASAVNTDANTQRAVNTCWKQGVAVTKTSNGGTTVGEGLAGERSLPGFIVRSGGLADAPIPVSIVPDNKAVLGAGLISDKSGGLISNGVPIVNLSPNSFISEQGGAFRADAGSGLISNIGGVSLISNKGGGILSQNEARLISDRGATLISDKGAGLIPHS